MGDSQGGTSDAGRDPGPARLDWIMLGLVGLFELGGYLLIRGSDEGEALQEPLVSPQALLMFAGSLGAILLLVRAASAARARGDGDGRGPVPRYLLVPLIGGALFVVGLILALLEGETPSDATLLENLVSPAIVLLIAGGTLLATAPFTSFGRARASAGSATARRSAGVGLALATGLLLAVPSIFAAAAHPWVTGAGARSETDEPVATHTDLFLMPLDGSGAKRLTITPDEDEVHPAISPDGTRIAVGRGSGLDDLDGWLLAVDGSDIARFTEWPGAVEDGFTWSPDGTRLAWWSDHVEATGADASPGVSPGAAPAPAPGQGPDAPARPDAGNEAIFDTWIGDANGAAPVRIAVNDSDEGVESWSPDGSRFCGWRFVDGQVDVHTFAVDGTDMVRVTDDPAEDWSCSWSPDGSRLVFHSLRDGDYEIFSAAPDGSDLRQLTDNDASDQLPRWSPDGTRIAYISAASGEIELYVMDADGGDPRNVSRDPGLDDGTFGIDWTPDGLAIVAASRGRPYPPDPGASAPAALASIALFSLLLMAIFGLTLRYRPPFGTFTIALLVLAGLLAIVGRELAFVAVALVTGLMADGLAAWRARRPGLGPVAVFGALTPGALVVLTAVAQSVATGLAWPGDMLVGAVLVAAFSGAVAAVIASTSHPWPGDPADTDRASAA